MKIAKIVASESHIEYLARVIDKLDVETPPQADDYGLGHFVSIKINKIEVIGIIANTELINPDFVSLGLRMSSEGDNQLFSPDRLNEQGIMIKILTLGYLENNVAVHKTPSQILPPQSEVKLLEEEKIKAFHRNDKGKLYIGYYTQVARVGGLMSNTLLNIVITKLQDFSSKEERKKLSLLKQNLNWQQTLGVFLGRG